MGVILRYNGKENGNYYIIIGYIYIYAGIIARLEEATQISHLRVLDSSGLACNRSNGHADRPQGKANSPP